MWKEQERRKILLFVKGAATDRFPVISSRREWLLKLLKIQAIVINGLGPVRDGDLLDVVGCSLGLE